MAHITIDEPARFAACIHGRTLDASNSRVNERCVDCEELEAHRTLERACRLHLGDLYDGIVLALHAIDAFRARNPGSLRRP